MVAQLVRGVVAAVHLIKAPCEDGAIWLSVVVPVLNEGLALRRFLHHLAAFTSNGVELIFVDGGSQDDTMPQLEAFVARTKQSKLLCANKGRALQMNKGAAHATGKLLLFLHADTSVPESVLTSLDKFRLSESRWGRFDVKLNNPSFIYRVISWFINKRSRLTGVATGDQALFVYADLFDELNGYENLRLMEDVNLTSRLRGTGKPFCISDPVVTSARKWESEGVVKTIVLMWRLRFQYYRGVSPDELVKRYYK